MAFEVVWHPSAQIDLVEVTDYIYQNYGWSAAKEFFDEVKDRVDDLSVFPELGYEYEGMTYKGKAVRALCVRQDTIVYVVEEKQITVVVFWDNRQNPARLERLISSR